MPALLTKPKGLVAIALLAASITLAPLNAHDVEQGPHGGPMMSAGDSHLELVVKGPEIAVYVTDKKHEPVATSGATGRAIVQADGKTTTIALTPDATNRLVGKAEGPLAGGARVVVSATIAGGTAMQARFVLK